MKSVSRDLYCLRNWANQSPQNAIKSFPMNYHKPHVFNASRGESQKKFMIRTALKTIYYFKVSGDKLRLERRPACQGTRMRNLQQSCLAKSVRTLTCSSASCVDNREACKHNVLRVNATTERERGACDCHGIGFIVFITIAIL